jgi:hypothetical protein
MSESKNKSTTGTGGIGIISAARSNDPIVSALTQRASDLSLSIVNPKTLATKLRESLVEIAGASAVSYHIGLAYDGKNIKVEIAHLSPHLIVKLTADMQSADIGLAYQTKTSGGWDVAVGLTVGKSFHTDHFHAPEGSGIVASFAVTISR